MGAGLPRRSRGPVGDVGVSGWLQAPGRRAWVHRPGPSSGAVMLGAVDNAGHARTPGAILEPRGGRSTWGAAVIGSEWEVPRPRLALGHRVTGVRQAGSEKNSQTRKSMR